MTDQTPIPQDEPIVFTSKGNVPASTLEYHHEWSATEDSITFREFYKDKTTGEIVKDSSHVLKLSGSHSASRVGRIV